MENNIVVVIIVGFLIFYLILMGKTIQFFWTATNLYKKMILRQEATLNLLMDIRDNTKYYDPKMFEEDDKASESEAERGVVKYCPVCNHKVPVIYRRCPQCGHNYE